MSGRYKKQYPDKRYRGNTGQSYGTGSSIIPTRDDAKLSDGSTRDPTGKKDVSLPVEGPSDMSGVHGDLLQSKRTNVLHEGRHFGNNIGNDLARMIATDDIDVVQQPEFINLVLKFDGTRLPNTATSSVDDMFTDAQAHTSEDSTSFLRGIMDDHAEYNRRRQGSTRDVSMLHRLFPAIPRNPDKH